MSNLKGRLQYQLFLEHREVRFKGELSGYGLLFISVTNVRNSHGSHEEVLPCLSQLSIEYNLSYTLSSDVRKVFI